MISQFYKPQIQFLLKFLEEIMDSKMRVARTLTKFLVLEGK